MRRMMRRMMRGDDEKNEEEDDVSQLEKFERIASSTSPKPPKGEGDEAQGDQAEGGSEEEGQGFEGLEGLSLCYLFSFPILGAMNVSW
jgi:hypothetical protein